MSDPEFEAMLDRMAEEMAEKGEEEIPLERHVWESDRETLFGCDDHKYRCGKCGSRLTVRADQSLNSAMDEQDVQRSCVEQTLLLVSKF